MLIPSFRSSFLFLIFLSASSVWYSAPAQTLRNLDGSVNIFGQFSGTSNGNGIKDNPTDSLGVIASARQSFHPWLGWEANYGYTRFSERYSGLPFGVQNNVHEASGAYLVQAPGIPFLGLQPYGAIGLGALVFLPTTVGGQKYSQQYRLAVLYEVGVNYPILTSHFGLRLQYRGLSYKTPDFKASNITTNSRRQTSEPSVGAYFRF